MPKAIWNDAVIAEAPSAKVELVEGNTYFPADAVRKDYLQASGHHSVCAWKGTASYYHVVVDGETNKDAAWYYPAPKKAAEQISGYIAFWHGVKIED
jgi:uncharacterized protein (DUF427 family)